jgi:hypothetical protein
MSSSRWSAHSEETSAVVDVGLPMALWKWLSLPPPLAQLYSQRSLCALVALYGEYKRSSAFPPHTCVCTRGVVRWLLTSPWISREEDPVLFVLECSLRSLRRSCWGVSVPLPPVWSPMTFHSILCWPPSGVCLRAACVHGARTICCPATAI